MLHITYVYQSEYNIDPVLDANYCQTLSKLPDETKEIINDTSALVVVFLM